jgi:hypothetical protein
MGNRGLPPQTSNFYCLPGRAGGTPMGMPNEAVYRTHGCVDQGQHNGPARRRGETVPNTGAIMLPYEMSIGAG